MYIYKSKLCNDVFLKNVQHSLAQNYLNEIDIGCDRFRGTPIPSLTFSKFRLYDETGDRVIYEKDYFERRRRIVMFLLRVWLFHEEEDIRELEDILWAICDEYTWALPAHLLGILTDESVPPNKVDLFAAETAHTIAETLSLCGDCLHPLVVNRCVSEIFRRVIEPFETGESEKYGLHWESALSNWAAVCGGCVGMTALYLIDDPVRRKKITDRAKAACNSFIASCKDDGVCHEGVSYWMYAMQYYVGFDELLQEVTGETLVLNEEKLKNIAQFPAYTCLPHNIPVKFSDCGSSLLFYGILCKLNERYGVSVPEASYYRNIADGCARTCGAVRTVAWFDPDLLSRAPKAGNAFLPEGQWAILHCGDMSVAVKGGSNDESHNHNDVGSYMYVKGCHILADELGAGLYTKDYFLSENRYAILNRGSHGHNLPIVNGCVQRCGTDTAADRFEQTETGVQISFADAYDRNAGLKALTRSLSLDQNGVCVKDCFAFSKNGNSVTERIITKLDAVITGENTVSITKDGETVGTVTFLTNGTARIVKDSYAAGSGLQSVTIIELESTTDTDNMELSYTIQ